MSSVGIWLRIWLATTTTRGIITSSRSPEDRALGSEYESSSSGAGKPARILLMFLVLGGGGTPRQRPSGAPRRSEDAYTGVRRSGEDMYAQFVRLVI
jgi:hypothetical protein